MKKQKYSFEEILNENRKFDVVSQIKYIVYQEINYDKCLKENDKEYVIVPLSDEDILRIHWFSERFNFDSHQVSDLVSLIKQTKKDCYVNKVRNKKINK